MAIAAGGPDVGMPPGVDREPGVIERRACPGGGGVARGAGGWKPAGDVIGVLHAGVVGLMTGVTVGRHGEVIVGDVAGRAGGADVNAGQRESRFGMVEGGAGDRKSTRLNSSH